MSNSDINRLKDLSADELFFELGGSLIGRQAAPVPEDEQRSTGRRWFEAKRELLQSIICNSEKVRRQHERLAAEGTTVIAAIADLVSGVCVGVSPFVVSALVVKHGLDSFCARFWCADE